MVQGRGIGWIVTLRFLQAVIHATIIDEIQALQWPAELSCRARPRLMQALKSLGLRLEETNCEIVEESAGLIKFKSLVVIKF